MRPRSLIRHLDSHAALSKEAVYVRLDLPIIVINQCGERHRFVSGDIADLAPTRQHLDGVGIVRIAGFPDKLDPLSFVAFANRVLPEAHARQMDSESVLRPTVTRHQLAFVTRVGRGKHSGWSIGCPCFLFGVSRISQYLLAVSAYT